MIFAFKCSLFFVPLILTQIGFDDAEGGGPFEEAEDICNESIVRIVYNFVSILLEQHISLEYTYTSVRHIPCRFKPVQRIINKGRKLNYLIILVLLERSQSFQNV